MTQSAQLKLIVATAGLLVFVVLASIIQAISPQDPNLAGAIVSSVILSAVVYLLVEPYGRNAKSIEAVNFLALMSLIVIIAFVALFANYYVVNP